MGLLALLALFLLPLSAVAQSVAPLGLEGSATVVHPMPGIDVYTDLHGHSATVLETAPGLQWYSARDPQGNVTAQGFLFDPMPRTPALHAPAFMPPPPSGVAPSDTATRGRR